MNKNIFDYLELNTERFSETTLLQAHVAEKAILVSGDARLGRAEIWKKALQIGAELAQRGYYKQPVAVIAGHHADTVLCFLGILASGNYYIPVAPDIKKERFEKICRMAGVRLAMGSAREEPEWLKGQEETIRYLSVEAAKAHDLQMAEIEELALRRQQLPEQAPMYLVFTSGSTGEPKGIIKTHQGLASFLDAYMEEFHFSGSDRLAGQTPFYFDASAKDIYLALKLKCQLHILEESYFVKPLQLAEYLQREQITAIQWVPSALGMLSRFRVFGQVPLPDLRMVFSVGEALPVKQLGIWMDGVPQAEYINLYGASEIAGICTFYRIHHLEDGQQAVPIGYALKNCKVYLAADGHLVTEPGKTGEIYVTGDALAAGYLQAEHAQKEVVQNGSTGSGSAKKCAFVSQPIPELPAGRYYKSGDLAEYGKNGELIFVSRKDSQIKHMGHRIELGEIEAASQKISQIQNSCCLYDPKKQKIVLFYEGSCDRAGLARLLKEELPAYMLPNKLVQLNQWPINANGKTDRRKLKDRLGASA